MKKKGFTLVELLGVITLLGLIIGLMFPPLLIQLKKASNSIDEATKSIIIVGASDYVEENKNDFPKINGKQYCIEFQNLVNENKISKDLKDSEGNKINLENFVKVIINDNKYNYEITDECNS